MEHSAEIFAVAFVSAQSGVKEFMQRTSEELGVSPAWLEYFLTRTKPGDRGCILWCMHTDKLGYGRAGRRGGEVKAHRISYALQFGPISRSIKVLHGCDTRNCINPFHLSLGTQAENVADMMKKGRHRCIPMFGAANPASRINEQTVLGVRRAVRDGDSQKTVSARFGLRPMHVSRIVRRELWPHVA